MKPAVHYHLRPLKRPAVLESWLAGMKRKTPPVNSSTKVCSVHFVDGDIVGDTIFFMKKVKNLKSDSFPSLFSPDNVQMIDSPTKQIISKAPQEKSPKVYLHERTERGRNNYTSRKRLLTFLHKPMQGDDPSLVY